MSSGIAATTTGGAALFSLLSCVLDYYKLYYPSFLLFFSSLIFSLETDLVSLLFSLDGDLDLGLGYGFGYSPCFYASL